MTIRPDKAIARLKELKHSAVAVGWIYPDVEAVLAHIAALEARVKELVCPVCREQHRNALQGQPSPSPAGEAGEFQWPKDDALETPADAIRRIRQWSKAALKDPPPSGDFLGEDLARCALILEAANATTPAHVMVPRDDNARQHADSILPVAMIFAGGEALDRCLANLKSDNPDLPDWDSEMIAVAVYRAMLAAAPAAPQGDGAVDYKKFAKELSNALLKVRPLGGSELFVKRGDDYYADPAYCGAAIDKMRDDLHEARIDAARLRNDRSPNRNAGIEEAAKRKAVLEEAAKVAEAESEMPGKPSDEHLAVMERVGPVENARAACRATKKSIAAAIRSLADKKEKA